MALTLAAQQRHPSAPAGVARPDAHHGTGGRAAGRPAGPRPAELASALRDGRLLVAQQPVVALGDGALCGSEALVRWQHPRLGLLLPGRFLPLVGGAVSASALDLHVLTAVCRGLAEDPGAPTVSVNVSRAALLSPGFVRAVLRVLREHEVAGERVMLELSEQLTLADLDAVGDELRLLRRHDVRLVLDDLGAGATTLQHVRRLRPAWVKVDRRLVTRVDEDARRLAVVRRVVDLAAAVGAGVTAEGVERPEEARALLAAGCRRGQGWLFGRPLLRRDPGAPTADGGAAAAG